VPDYLIATNKPKKKDNHSLKIEFYCTGKIENATKHKQECSCPSLPPSLRSHTRLVPFFHGDVVFANPSVDNKLLINN